MISSRSVRSAARSSTQPANCSCRSAREPFRHRLVRRVADQDVAEPEAVLAGEGPRDPGGSAACGRAPADGGRRRATCSGGVSSATALHEEHLAHHRGPLQHRQLVLREQVEPGREHGLHGAGHAQRVDLGERPRAGRPARRAARPRRACAASPRGRAGCRRSRARPRRPRRDRAARPRFSSRRSASSRCSGASWIVALATHAGRTSARSGRARQQTRIGASRLQPGEILDEVEERGLRPLDVVEHEHDAGARAPASRAAGGPPSRARRCASAARRARSPRGSGRARSPPSGSPARTSSRSSARTISTERPVRDPVPVGQAAPFEHERLVAGRGDRARRRAATCRRPARRRSSRSGSSARPRRRRAPRSSASSSASRPTSGESIRRATPGRDRIDVEQAPGVDRLRLALQVERRHRLGRDRIAHEPERRVADEDLAAGRGRLEPLRDDDRVAGCERPVPAPDRRRSPRRC